MSLRRVSARPRVPAHSARWRGPADRDVQPALWRARERPRPGVGSRGPRSRTERPAQLGSDRRYPRPAEPIWAPGPGLPIPGFSAIHIMPMFEDMGQLSGRFGLRRASLTAMVVAVLGIAGFVLVPQVAEGQSRRVHARSAAASRAPAHAST